MLKPLVLSVLVSSIASPVWAQSASGGSGKIAFQACAACHGTKPGDVRMGPTLAGVAGRKAGAVKGYAYSDAMSKSGVTWTDAKLDAFMANPKDVMPGTKMVYRGVSSPAQRQAIIGYLKTLPGK